MKTITEALNWRYTTKAFDATKKISDQDFAEIENILHLSPTSTNLQPLHFIVANDEAGKKRVLKGATDFFSFNAQKIEKASHVIVFCSKAVADDAHLKEVIEQEDKDGRFTKPEFKAQMDGGRRTFLNIHRYALKDEAHWHAKQAYITFGAVLLGAAELGIDATPIEGVDFAKLDEEFGLRAQGYTVQAVIALGYRNASEDLNASLPKSRLPRTKIISKA